MQFAQSVLQFIADHSQLIAAVATILLACLQVTRSTGNLREGLLALMLRAEKASGTGELGDITGERIMGMVVKMAMDRVVPTLPFYVRPFITEQTVRRVAYYAYAETKLYLQSGRLVSLSDFASAAYAAPDPLPAPPAVSPAAQPPAAPQQPPAAS